MKRERQRPSSQLTLNLALYVLKPQGLNNGAHTVCHFKSDQTHSAISQNIQFSCMSHFQIFIVPTDYNNTFNVPFHKSYSPAGPTISRLLERQPKVLLCKCFSCCTDKTFNKFWWPENSRQGRSVRVGSQKVPLSHPEVCYKSSDGREGTRKRTTRTCRRICC